MIKLVVLVACVGASLAAYTTHDHHNHGHGSHHHENNHLGQDHGGHHHGEYDHGGHHHEEKHHAQHSYGGSGHNDHDYHKPANYGFEYGVRDPYTGANFGHQEDRKGHVTKGSYYVQLPDGRTQKVSYTADKHGYHPVITYEGHASFPAHHKAHHKGGYH